MRTFPSWSSAAQLQGKACFPCLISTRNVSSPGSSSAVTARRWDRRQGYFYIFPPGEATSSATSRQITSTLPPQPRLHRSPAEHQNHLTLLGLLLEVFGLGHAEMHQSPRTAWRRSTVPASGISLNPDLWALLYRKENLNAYTKSFWASRSRGAVMPGQRSGDSWVATRRVRMGKNGFF